ncbi:MAG: SUMF1/EgtB/PvdO family nonheme iron enzyme [Candidatus Zipacnadales bacterium]
MSTIIVIPFTLLLCLSGHAQPIEGLGVVFLPSDNVPPGESAARELAVSWGGQEVSPGDDTLILPNDLHVLWWHCEQIPLPAVIDRPTVKRALLAWVEQGHGLFLSGTALSYVQSLGLEPIAPRLGQAGNDTFVASIHPGPAPQHPVYKGFQPSQPIPMASAGYPSFSDFYNTGGPLGANVIGNAYPDAGEKPFIEYGHGRGRIICLGWRLPHYGLQNNKHRQNLERLTANILTYLAEGQWFGQIEDSRRRALRAELDRLDVDSIRRAVVDLMETFPDRYSRGQEYLALLDRVPEVKARALEGDERALEEARRLIDILSSAMLDNPLLDFESLLLIKRFPNNLGLPQNWQSNSCLPRSGFDNEIMVLSPVRPDGELRTLYRPEKDVFVGDIDLHFDGKRMLFSSIGDNGCWQIFEMNVDGSGLQQLPLIYEPDVDNYDACYLPSDDILFTSTAPFVGVPCVTGSSHVSNIYLYERASGNIRRLTFEQDHDWCPVVMNNGRIMYLRWEYSDIPHFVSRLLFHMDPDGTGQMEFYGSNSYWPNAMFYARPIPGHPTRFVAVVGGHHDNPRMGELVLFDAAKGKHEADGVVQRIPGYGKPVEPVILDGLTLASWPKFLHPYPLNDKYFLVACRPTPASLWGIYLADVFDNLTLIKELPGYALLEPLPLRPTKRPPVIPNKVDPTRKDALVYMADVYEGPGLAGVPRGTVKKLRLFTYHFAYHGMGGQVNRVGLDGPWDIKRIIGTVPVEEDGSAFFRVPANTPLSVQPLDEQGQALQLMRSWMTAMPGEILSCVGCHEPQRVSVPVRGTQASARAPSEITPWYGPTRGFSFVREVQPVLDRNCIICHNDQPEAPAPDLRNAPLVHPPGPDNAYQRGSLFSPSYLALRRYVRAHTIESDIHLLMPGEFCADTTRLVQMLREGHHGVALSAEDWDRLITWIDLNTPFHGTWHEIVGHEKVDHQRDRRRAMDARYAGLDEDPEAIWEPPPHDLSLHKPNLPDIAERVRTAPAPPPSWPFDAQEARRRQEAAGEVSRLVDLGNGIQLELVRIPAGGFMGREPLASSETIRESWQEIGKPFWIGKFEVTNEQFVVFDPSHDSRLEHGDFLQFSVEERGYPVNEPQQPVCRVSWNKAREFCEWLSAKASERFTLPTEQQWEYACRAGTATPLWYGDESTNFARFANLADRLLSHIDTFAPWNLPFDAIAPWRPAIETVDDGHRVSAPVGSYQPNAWGLYDMHGNVAEWTLDEYHDGRKVVRGGSWYDRPKRARSDFRCGYPAYRGVYDVGFRVVCATS